jgi:hypothetical protein
VALLGLTLAPWCATRAEADRIVLRNLDVIHDRTVVEFDEDGVRLDNGRILSWDQIETGRVEEARQADFDRLLRELGTDLYRIRQRLTVGDYRGLLPHAEALQDRFLGRSGDTAYMVFQSLMWARLEAGRREQAAVAYLHCLEYLTSAGAKPQHELPGKRRLQFDPQTGLTPELVPVWFDAEAARDSLSELTDTIARMRSSRLPAARIYHATLALAAGDLSAAEQALAELDGHDAWRALLRAQLQLAAGNPSQAEQTLAQVAETVAPELKPIMLYWLGTARLAQADRDRRSEGLLDLLRLAALFGARQPELAAGALDTVRQFLAQQGDAKGSVAVRRELLDRYSQTWHARRIRGEDTDAR